MIRGLTRIVSISAFVAAVSLGGKPAAAQAIRVAGGATVGTARFASEIGALSEDVSGLVYGAQAHFWLGVLQLDMTYLQGALGGDGGADRDLVEGEVMLGVRFLPWVTAKLGPQIRAYTTAGGTERWVLWEGRLRAETGVFAPIVRSYVEGWITLSGDINTQQSFDSGEGFEAGMWIQLPSSPVGFRFGYRVERDRLAGPDRQDTLQQILLGLNIGRR